MSQTVEIRKEVVLKARPERIWSCLTTRDGWEGWFSDKVEGSFDVGGILKMQFEDVHTCFAKVVERVEGTAFAYRWHPGEDCPMDRYPESEMTTVRFELAPHPDGTLLVVTESGFENVPAERREKTVELNSGGWKIELVELAAYAERGDIQLLGLDEIVRTIDVAADISRVWEAVATAKGWESFFFQEVPGEFKVGELTVCRTQSGNTGPLKVTALEAPHRFAYLWHPGEMEGCSWTDYPESEATSVEFLLTSIATGTRVTVKESGFSRVRKAHKHRALELNAEGWSIVLGWLKEAAEAKVGA